MVPRRRVDPAGPPDLHLALGTEAHGPRIRLGPMVRSVHAALIRGAVSHAEHVARLVHGRLESPPQAGGEVLVRVALTVERPDADPIAERRLAEDEVPA